MITNELKSPYDLYCKLKTKTGADMEATYITLLSYLT